MTRLRRSTLRNSEYTRTVGDKSPARHERRKRVAGRSNRNIAPGASWETCREKKVGPIWCI